MAKIKGGYYMKARCIQDSEISIMPPYIREIWDWLLKEANHSDKKSNGLSIKRGQLIRTFKDIQEGLKWMIGWRKMTYKKWQCENAMKFLRERTMITTMKTTRGMLITICNYSLYQDPKNYESNKRTDRITTDPKQTTDTINKNDKNVKNDKKKECKKRISKDSFDNESVVYQLVIYLEGKIRENNEAENRKPKKTESQLQSWCKDMDLLLRKDKTIPDEVKKVIDYVVEDNFWAKNILCPASLRKQYSRLYKQFMDRGRSLEEKLKVDHRFDNLE